MRENIESICRSCFHSCVCGQFNEHRNSYNEKCHFFNDHFVPAANVVVLPCKVGDILYYFPEWYARSGYEPTPISVEEVNSFSGNVVVECYMDPDTRVPFLPADFGKTVFLTLEEAEAALKGGADNA